MSELLFEYKVRARHRLGWKEFSFYATTEIEEFLNRNSIDYVRNATDTVENRLFKENKRLNNIIKTMEKYFELIIDLGYDYDGLNEKESLKKLIDELCRYASLGRVYNTNEPVYVNGDKKYNILNEELKESDKE